MTYDQERRLCVLMAREASLNCAERLEMESLLELWEMQNDPINFPPPDADLLRWSGYQEIM